MEKSEANNTETGPTLSGFAGKTQTSPEDSCVTPREQRPELRRGRLKNGNPSGDYRKAPRCGARNRQGKPCQCPAMRGKSRCRLHGGLSTGPKTKEGIHRIRAAHWKDGSRSARLQAEAKAEAARQEEEIRKNWMEACNKTTITINRLLGGTGFPKITVRIRGIAKEPPLDWLK